MATRALIIANSTYDDDHFATLPAAAADAAQLAAVLGDPDIAGFEVETLVDVGQRAAMRALESFFTRAGRDDLLLLHLSLHGWKDVRNRLYFVMRDTERDYPGSTAVSAETVGTFMGESRSRRIVVLLDCCYSGAFTLNALRRDAGTPTVDIAEPFAGNGRVVLTASTALQYAHESEQDVRYSRTPAQPSVFTSAVVRGLRDGSADLDGDGLVSVDELYDYVHEQVRQRIAGQTPTLSVDSAQGTIYLARSPRHGDVDRLAEMRAAVLDVQPWKRIGSLHLVEQLLGSVREPTRDAARAALLGLIADADREVARRARQLWHERGLGDIPTARAARPARPSPPRRLTGTSGPVVGIDFGTTNSSIALLEGEDVRLIPNAEGALTTPSLVAVTADGGILVGTAAKRQSIANPDYTVRSVKLRLGTDWSITRGAVQLTAEDAAELILRRLREDAEAYAGEPPRLAVMTVPANFDLVQRAVLVESARRAGLDVRRVLNEPTAAALTYGLNREEDATVLIFDLGGGTLDVTLIEVGDGLVEVKATCGDNHLGGDDWDQRIVQHLLRRVWDRHGVDLTQDVPARQRLQEAAEAAKVELSSASSATVRLPFLSSTADFPVHLDETLTRTEFEGMTRDLLARCRRPIEQAIRDAGIRHSELDQVILTGGATRMPAIGELVRRLTGGRQPYRGLIPEGIVTGAAIQGGVLAGGVKDVLLLDVVSASLGFETYDGTVLKVIERNTTIPTLRWAFVATSENGQTTMTVHVVEGESPNVTDNRTLAVLEVSDLPRHPRRTPVIEVVLDVDANTILHVTAKELRGHTHELAGRASELAEARAALGRVWSYNSPEAERLRAKVAALEAKYFTGREWQTTVDRSSMTRAASLLQSPQWQALRGLAPLAWEAPEP
ncbi:Hsp70 family protein [Streptomyces sp. NL15-2K]|uniref:caspase, EACC1-associated type n=1 Tax=Streptomyces sp. NL15-2K TaxID=376149 RepID=UPI000F56454E|nr:MULTISPECIES: Hsp70 family protein [Actinomycetes]WKX06105.1 Hsp70 family protein [Kutzneria buriramensis]GCB52766.1 chaperone protein dnaK [Streptomyces sp. NL15-2K]